MNRLAIFDCDGTLVDSGASIHRALETTLTYHGHECPPRSDAQRVIGLSLDQAFAMLVPDGDHGALSATYRDAFFSLRSNGEIDEPLFEGIDDLLDRLDGEGWLLGIATGKSLRGLNHCLERHGLGRRFVTLQTADTHPSKPDPSMLVAAMAEAGAGPQTSVFVGDTAWDMGAARAAGCGALGADWGYHSAAELTDGGAHRIASRPADVVQLATDWEAGRG